MISALPHSTSVSEGLYQILSGLESNALITLFQGKILALRIPGFYSVSLCDRATRRLLEDSRFSYYTFNKGASNVGRIGMAYCETLGDPTLEEQYYSQALLDIRQSRDLFSPYLSPMDKLRLELQEIWSFGANLENLNGKTMNVGLVRVFKPKAHALPHQDILRRDAVNCSRACELKTQLAANIYLQTAEGGALEIWSRKTNDREYDALKIPGSYGLKRRCLGSPDLVIEPEIGDLILFDANNIHAVTSIRAGVRVTMSCFVGFRGEDRPLTQWS